MILSAFLFLCNISTVQYFAAVARANRKTAFSVIVSVTETHRSRSLRMSDPCAKEGTSGRPFLREISQQVWNVTLQTDIPKVQLSENRWQHSFEAFYDDVKKFLFMELPQKEVLQNRSSYIFLGQTIGMSLAVENLPFALKHTCEGLASGWDTFNISLENFFLAVSALTITRCEGSAYLVLSEKMEECVAWATKEG